MFETFIQYEHVSDLKPSENKTLEFIPKITDAN